MALFSSSGRHTDKAADKKRVLIIIITAIVLVAVVVTATMVLSGMLHSDNQNTEETRFVEQKPDVVKKDEYITVNDPLLGSIEIKAVEGFAKNAYNSDNFVLDETGKMTYYIDDEVASCMGVDLSEYQGEVDFAKLKEQGFDFVILRIGGRYYSEQGDMYVDTNLHNYYKAAKDAGLRVGGYFFSQAKNAQDAIDEANFALENIKGMKFDYPIAFDWEHIEGDTARTDNVSTTDLTDAAIAFCDTIKEAGFESIIYTNTYLMYYEYELERLKDYEFWIADYEYKPSMYYNFTMWQYDIEGQVEGIEGPVDMNICMKNY